MCDQTGHWLGSHTGRRGARGAHTVSTASRIVPQTEQELLAVVYALQKFTFFVFGHQITLYSDNLALTFLKKCAMASSRITRWVTQLQEYYLKVTHKNGTNNCVTDLLSHKPAGPNPGQINLMMKPWNVLVAVFKLNLDSAIKAELKGKHTSQPIPTSRK
jgi:hypothetical protein